MDRHDAPLPIVLMTTGLAIGGAETQLVRLATHLDRERWAPGVISLLPGGELEQELMAAKIPVNCLGMRRGVPSLNALVRAVKLLREARPSVLVSFMFHANLIARIAGHIAGVPIVISSIRSENFGSRWRDRALQWTDWLAEATTTNSETVREALVARKVAPRRKLRVIPNSVQANPSDMVEDQRSRLRAEFGLSDNHFLWVAVGSLGEAKDYPTLLAAFHRVLKDKPEARLVIAGDGPLKSAIEDLLSGLGLEGKAILLGFRDDVDTWLAASDGFVSASAWEGMPNAVMEAMASGKPVVGTAVGGMKELVSAGITGFLVPPRSSEELAKVMQRVMDLAGPELQQMGQLGRCFVAGHYGLERVMSMWEALFEELVKGRR